MHNVSVIIPAFNAGRYIDETIRSVLRQTYGNVEILVIDDGSTDDTAARVGRYGGNVRYFYQINRGVSAARNRGIRESAGDYIAFLDADDLWLPEKLEKQVEAMRQSPSVGLVAAQRIGIIGPDGTAVGEVVNEYSAGREDLLERFAFDNAVLGAGSSALIRRECFEAVGYFDETLKVAEDWEMWFRIARRYDVKFIDGALLKVRTRADGISAPVNADRLLEDELAVLGRIFSTAALGKGWMLKSKAYANRYFKAAWALFDTGRKRQAGKCLLKSFFLNPLFFFFAGGRAGLSVRVFLGDAVFRMLKTK